MKTNTKNLILAVLILGFFTISSNYSFAITNPVGISKNNITVSGKVSVDTPSPKTSDASNQGNTFINNGAPIIVSTTVNQITDTGATLEGTVNPNGYDTDAWFHVGAPINPPLGLENIGSGTSPVALTPYVLTGLLPNTTYNFRVEATNTKGFSRGSWVSFTTLKESDIPILDSISPSNGDRGQTLNITLTGNNFSPDATVNFSGSGITINSQSVDSITSITANISISGNASTGGHNVTITNLNGTSNAIIFSVNSYGGGGGGGGGGGQISTYIGVITQNATNTSKISATLNGLISPNNFNATAWFEYGTSANLSSYGETAHVSFVSGSSYSNLSQSLTNLSPNTTYYFRAVANNYANTIRGSILSFNTGDTSTTVDINSTNEGNTGSATEISPVESANQTTIDNNYFNNTRDLAAAGILGLGEILPHSILGWLILLILILLIVIISRKLYQDYTEHKTLKGVSANHIENLPF